MNQQQKTINTPVMCPKCNKEALTFNFCGNNGYVTICGTCKELLYYCSILGKVTMFKPTREEFELNWQDVYYSQEEIR